MDITEASLLDRLCVDAVRDSLEANRHKERLRPRSDRGDLAADPMRRVYGSGQRAPFASNSFRRVSAIAQPGNGNLMQRTRCPYFIDPAFPQCNKRAPGTGCGAFDGSNRVHAIFGSSEHCIAVHPSDMCVALAALDATIHVQGRSSQRSIAIRDFHRLPGDRPDLDNILAPQELILSIDLPPSSLRGALKLSQGARPRQL